MQACFQRFCLGGVGQIVNSVKKSKGPLASVDLTRNESAPLVLQMRCDHQDWMVIDVSFNGLSLIVSYRANFIREISLADVIYSKIFAVIWKN